MCTWGDLRRAYEHWDTLESNDIKDAAYSVVLALMNLYNESCTFCEDEVDEGDLPLMFGE